MWGLLGVHAAFLDCLISLCLVIIKLMGHEPVHLDVGLKDETSD